MNEVIQAMLTRRSIHGFKPDVQVPRELMDQIIQAGTYAANGRGRQSAIIVAITNQALRARLSFLRPPKKRLPGTDLGRRFFAVRRYHSAISGRGMYHHFSKSSWRRLAIILRSVGWGQRVQAL